jgi:hypothetical protein
MGILRFTTSPPPYGPGKGVIGVGVSSLKMGAVVYWPGPVMYTVAVIPRSMSQVFMSVRPEAGP